MEEQTEPTIKESIDFKKIKPPNKKKFEEELEVLLSKIRDLETQHATAKSDCNIRPLRSIRSEKEATFDRNKKINNDLKLLNQEIQGKIYSVSQMQSGIVYKSEDKNNDAIRKLEWNLAHHSYRLTEERKIVAEIDKLKRSKISLCAYNNAKGQLDELRNKQRRMREERDHYSKTITSLRAQEDEAKRKLSANRGQSEALKKEIDDLYQGKRKLVDDFKKNQAEFQEAQKKRRQESFKKKEEERKALLEAKQREEEELDQLQVPYDGDRQLCNTLISYLQGFSYPTDSLINDKTSVTTSSTNQNTGANSSGPAEELEDGNLILLKKCDDNDFIGANIRKQNKKGRKPRKPSMTKLITHCPQVISQFASLNLQAPCSIQEIPASLEQLRARKLYYEQKAETQSNISLTESGICEMSRQVSNTESCGSACETRAPDHIFDELLSEKICCPEFPPEADAIIEQVDNHSTDSSNTPRNLSVSSGSIMSTDVDEIDSSVQSLENSGHLSQFDQSENPIDSKRLNEVLYSQTETVSQSNDKPQLNQSVPVYQGKVENSICGILGEIPEQVENDVSVQNNFIGQNNVCEESDMSDLKQTKTNNLIGQNMTNEWEDNNSMSVTSESKTRHIDCKNIVKKVNHEDVQFESNENDSKVLNDEVTHL